MLQKIISIKNIGRFYNCAAAGDVTFRRVTLIFAENGRGKTTLCAILRSLFTNTPAIIIGRTTLGSTEQAEVQLLLRTGNFTFRNGAWDSAFQDIAVFDGTYVSENVFAGDVVETEHRRNLYRVIIGSEGVVLAKRITELDNQIRGKNTEIRDGRAHLQRYVPESMTVETFIALPEDTGIDVKIAEKVQELQAVQRATQLQQRAGLTAIMVPALATNLARILAKTLVNVEGNAEKRVADHIARHHMEARGEPWLTEGLNYVVEESCPFCGQSLARSELIRAYREFFSEEYHGLRDEVTGLDRQIDSDLGEDIIAAIHQTLLQNSSSSEFWQQYCVIAPPILPEVARLKEIILTLRQCAKSLLQKKTATPLDAVAPDDNFTQALTSFEALRTSLNNYNAAVAVANAVVTATRQATQAADVRLIEASLARLRAQKVRYGNDVRGHCAADTSCHTDKETLEREKDAVRQQLDTHTQQVITRYGQSINRLLERINAGFRITTPTHTYRGGPPSTSYQIVINQNSVDLGDGGTPLDRASFKNTLSAGDRSTLALAFFLAQLEQDTNRAEKIVVFDDPFTSMDSFRRTHTVHQVYKCAGVCAQVVVLSHDSGFLKLLWDRVPPADRKTLQFARIREENTVIAEWDIEKAVMSRYRMQIDDLQRFFSDGEGEARDVIQKLRTVLEGYCRNLYPVQFSEQDTLGIIVGKINAGGAAHPLQSIADDLDEVNLYCRRYHHGENPNAAMEPIVDAELQAYVRRTLGIVGCLL